MDYKKKPESLSRAGKDRGSLGLQERSFLKALIISFIALSLFLSLLVVSACSKDCTSFRECDKDQLCIAGKCQYKSCEYNTDCRRKCFTGSCVDGKCSYSIVEGCCGNYVCEDGEDYCNCKIDCKKKCDGKVVVGKTRTGKSIYADYLGYSCQETNGKSRCVLGVEKSRIVPKTVVDTQSFGAFKLQTKISYNEPFDIKKDYVTLEFSLKDASDNLVYPVKINEIRVMSSSVLLGGRQTIIELGSLGSSASRKIALDNTKLMVPESKKKLKIEVDYEFTKKLGSREETLRNTYKYTIGSVVLYDATMES